jgi:hypothetical protein
LSHPVRWRPNEVDKLPFWVWNLEDLVYGAVVSKGTSTEAHGLFREDRIQEEGPWLGALMDSVLWPVSRPITSVKATVAR